MLTPEREKELRKLASLEMQDAFAEIDRLRGENEWLCDSRNKLAGESQSLTVERDRLREKLTERDKTNTQLTTELMQVTGKLAVAERYFRDIKDKDPSWTKRNEMCDEALSKIRGEK
jgi:predicted nuclease with TOPRIM domain